MYRKSRKYISKFGLIVLHETGRDGASNEDPAPSSCFRSQKGSSGRDKFGLQSSFGELDLDIHIGFA